MLAVFACALLAWQAFAQISPVGDAYSNTLTVLPDDTVDGLFDHLIHASDTNAACPKTGSQRLNADFVADETWACVSLTNAGEARSSWRIGFEGLVYEGSTIWLRQSEKFTPILTAPIGRRLEQQETGSPWLTSLPFAVLPDETIEIWVKFDAGSWFGHARSAGLPKLVPEKDYRATLDLRFLMLGAQMAGCVLLIGYFLAFSALLRSTPARRYAFYFVAATLTLISYYGLIPYYLTSQPVMRLQYINRIFEIAMIVLHLRFMASFTQESIGSHRILRLAPWLILSIPMSFAMIFLLEAAAEFVFVNTTEGGLVSEFGFWVWVNSNLIYPITVVVSWSTFSIWSSVLLLQRRTDGAWLYAAGALLLIIAPFVQLLSTLFSQTNIFTVLYVASLFGFVDAIIFAAAIVRLTFGLRTQRDLATQEALAATEEKLQLSQSLLNARENLHQANVLAEQHRSRLALTGHDLRQPLVSLRLALDDDAALSSKLRTSLSSSLSYLKSVLDQILEDTRPEAADDAPMVTSAPPSEPVPLEIILKNSVRMFASEAQAKDLDLDFAPTSAVTTTEPIDLIRMVSNLVSNAVKYTVKGRILVGVRRRGGRLSIAVYDTGPGLTRHQIDQITKSYRRADTSTGTEGEGLGLAGVKAMADANGLSLSIQSQPDKGSCFAIEGLMRLNVEDDALD